MRISQGREHIDRVLGLLATLKNDLTAYDFSGSTDSVARGRARLEFVNRFNDLRDDVKRMVTPLPTGWTDRIEGCAATPAADRKELAEGTTYDLLKQRIADLAWLLEEAGRVAVSANDAARLRALEEENARLKASLEGIRTARRLPTVIAMCFGILGLAAACVAIWMAIQTSRTQQLHQRWLDFLSTEQGRPTTATHGLFTDRVLILWTRPFTITPKGYLSYDHSYHLFRRKLGEPGDGTDIGRVEGSKAAIWDKNAVPGTRYQYRIYRYPVDPANKPPSQQDHKWLVADGDAYGDGWVDGWAGN